MLMAWLQIGTKNERQYIAGGFEQKQQEEMALFLSKSKRGRAAETVRAYVGQRVADKSVPYSWEFLDGPGAKTGISVATEDNLTVAALQATVRMTGLYRAAMNTDPMQDGAEPWEAVLSAAEARNGGVDGSAGGSGTPIVTDSRSPRYCYAASAAIAALRPRDEVDLPHVIKLASQARGLSPVDVTACMSALRSTRGTAALEKATADVGGDPAVACQMFGEAAAWDPSLAENQFNGDPMYASLCLTHSAELQTHRSAAEKTVAHEMEQLVGGAE